MATTSLPIEFSIRRIGGGKIKGKFEHTPPGKSDEEVEFDGPDLTVDLTMVDDGGTGLRFPDQLDRAIYVTPVNSKHDPCPTQAAKWCGFEPLEVRDQGRTLRVFNPNDAVQLFKFSLNFTANPSDPASRLEPWDPIGSNRNGGGIPLRDFSFSKAVLGVGAAVAALAAVARLIKGKL